MRRAVLALLGTAAGTTLLIGLKSGTGVGHPAVAGAQAPLDQAVPGAPAPGPVPAGGAGAATTGPAPRVPSAPAPTTTGGRPAPPAPPPPPPARGLKSGTFTGPVVTNRYGPVQVSITVSGGRITDVTAVQTPSSHAESVRINRRAVPILRQEALAAQSANIDTVSGATYTSGGYRSSLQAALDAARR